MVYNIDRKNEREVVKMSDQEKALQELLRLLADHPELADRITITIKPSKIRQGEAEETEE